jgi:hypothetical protein
MDRKYSGPEEHIQFFVFTLKFAMVSCCSRKQSSVALSTTEADYIALTVRSSVASQASNRFT